MGVNRSQIGKDLEKAGGSKAMEKILKTNTAMSKEQQKAYTEYKKDVKNRGGKEVATPEQFKKIQQRLAARKGITRRTGRRKSKLGLGDTVRTKAVSKSLKSAGLTDSELARLRGKKK